MKNTSTALLILAITTLLASMIAYVSGNTHALALAISASLLGLSSIAVGLFPRPCARTIQ
jgi:hypothetical protein